MSMEEDNRKDLIKMILESEVIESEDGVLRVPTDYSLCFFCQGIMREIISFNFVMDGSEKMISVPLCKHHLNVLDEDNYKLKM